MTMTRSAGLPGTPPASFAAQPASPAMSAYVPPGVARRRSRTGPRLLAVLVATFVLGYALAHIPSPSRVGDLWIGNLAAPYLVVPALAGAWAGRRLLHAAAAGAVAGAGLVLGFYNVVGAALFALRPGAASMMGLPDVRDVSAFGLVADSLRRWFGTFLLAEPGGTPWLTIAVLVGLVMGPVGYLFRRASGFVLVVLAAALVAGPFLAEVAFHVLASAGGMRSLPVIGAVGWPMTPRNALVLAGESAVGVVSHLVLVAIRFLPTRAISLG